jgi:hypothetical protein
MLRLAMIFLMLFIHNACAQDGVLRMDQVVGTWRLIAASASSGSTRNDAPYGPTPSGLITYSSDGRVMAIICHSGRKPLASGDRISASTDERAEAFATSFSYAGRYSLSGNKIIHRVELGSVQNWVDNDLVRLVRLDDSYNATDFRRGRNPNDGVGLGAGMVSAPLFLASTGPAGSA